MRKTLMTACAVFFAASSSYAAPPLTVRIDIKFYHYMRHVYKAFSESCWVLKNPFDVEKMEFFSGNSTIPILTPGLTQDPQNSCLFISDMELPIDTISRISLNPEIIPMTRPNDKDLSLILELPRQKKNKKLNIKYSFDINPIQCCIKYIHPNKEYSKKDIYYYNVSLNKGEEDHLMLKVYDGSMKNDSTQRIFLKLNSKHRTVDITPKDDTINKIHEINVDCNFVPKCKKNSTSKGEIICESTYYVGDRFELKIPKDNNVKIGGFKTKDSPAPLIYVRSDDDSQTHENLYLLFFCANEGSVYLEVLSPVPNMQINHYNGAPVIQYEKITMKINVIGLPNASPSASKQDPAGENAKENAVAPVGSPISQKEEEQ